MPPGTVGMKVKGASRQFIFFIVIKKGQLSIRPGSGDAAGQEEN